MDLTKNPKKQISKNKISQSFTDKTKITYFLYISATTYFKNLIIKLA